MDLQAPIKEILMQHMEIYSLKETDSKKYWCACFLSGTHLLGQSLLQSLNHISQPFWLWGQVTCSQADISELSTRSRCHRCSWCSVLCNLHVDGLSLGYNQLSPQIKSAQNFKPSLSWNSLSPQSSEGRRWGNNILISPQRLLHLCFGKQQTSGLEFHSSCNLFWNQRDFILFWKPST